MNSCTFIGHRDCSQEIKQELYSTIEMLIVKENVRVFYVGTHGGFDRIVYHVLTELERKYDIEVIVVLAYLNDRNVYYDTNKTLFPNGLEGVPQKYAIRKRNEYMLKRSQYMLCYVNNTYSNADKFISTAKHLGMQIINLGELII